jgi:hypothetical protein
MYRIKNSFSAFIGLLALIGMFALLTPRTGQSQTDTVGPAKPVLVINALSEPVPVTGTVNVGNLGNGPLPVRDVDNGLQPFHESVGLFLAGGNSGNSETLLTVPAGKRFILETVSARAELAAVDTPNRVEIITQLGGKPVLHEILLSRQGLNLNGQPVFVGTHSIRAYSDPGTEVKFQFSRSDTTNNASADVTISGYFVDLP